MMTSKHQLYTSEDFKHLSGQEMEESQLAKMVIDGGLSICKVCGEGESGLEKPCRITSKISIKKVIEISEDNRAVIEHNGNKQFVSMGLSNLKKDLSHLVGKEIEVSSMIEDFEGKLVFPVYLNQKER